MEPHSDAAKTAAPISENEAQHDDVLIEFEDKGSYDPGFFHMWINTSDDIRDLNRLSCMTEKPDWTSSFLHEYIHFLQDLTTTHGLLYLSHSVEHLKNAIKHIRDTGNNQFVTPLLFPNNFNWSTNDALLRVYRGRPEPDMPPRHGIEYLSYSSTLESIADKNQEIIQAPKYQVYYQDIGAHQQMQIHFGSIHIKEYMAHAVQCQFSPTTKHEIFPYSIVEFIIKKEVPRLAANESFMIALCDASLMVYHPAQLFFEALKRMQSRPDWVPHDIEAVYDFVLSGVRTQSREGDQDIHSRFVQTADMAAGHFRNCLRDEYFKDDVAWFEELIAQSKTWRIRHRGFISKLIHSRESFSNVFTNITNSFGIPFTTNNRHQGFFAPPAKLVSSKIRPDFPRVFKAIGNTFRGGSKCLMHSVCEQRDYEAKIDEARLNCCDCSASGPLIAEQITDEYCLNKPWERIRKKNGCPYTVLWRTWGLEGKTPITQRDSAMI